MTQKNRPPNTPRIMAMATRPWRTVISKAGVLKHDTIKSIMVFAPF
jgi:hypothetical protein